ncbi:hypothetical protein [Paracoccus zeaxanthinifaciens]|uniref:hypothetical protein n=1 Tax=Paracoccus zeaxanthinifaciens TaxID=187400 RepID=UPI0003B3579C|nr:hypothetical protein [Paracoccus zeaxanthinifaciens]
MTLTPLEKELLACVEELEKSVSACMQRQLEQEKALAELRSELNDSLSTLHGALEAGRRPLEQTEPEERKRTGFIRRRP